MAKPDTKVAHERFDRMSALIRNNPPFATNEEAYSEVKRVATAKMYAWDQAVSKESPEFKRLEKIFDIEQGSIRKTLKRSTWYTDEFYKILCEIISAKDMNLNGTAEYRKGIYLSHILHGTSLEINLHINENSNYFLEEILWREVDHSRVELAWGPIPDNQKVTLRKIISTYYGLDVSDCSFEYLSEGTATRNFKVTLLDGGKFFLKIHAPRARSEDIHRSRGISRSISDSPIFQKEFAEILLPEKNVHDSQLTDISTDIVKDFYADEHVKFVELFKFCENVTHFNPNESNQLSSVADKFGNIQLLVRDLELEIGDGPGFEPYRIEFDQLKRDILSIDSSMKSSSILEMENSAFIEIWMRNRDAILSGLAKAEGFSSEIENYKDSIGIFYHDMHPHNAFFRNDECVLIYDFERVGQFIHEEVVSYAVHRFVREIIRVSLKTQGRIRAQKKIPIYVELFLKNYTRIVPFLPDRIREVIPSWIRISALKKLRSVSRHLLLLNTDSHSRTPAQILDEVRKFVGFLHEAEIFEAELGGVP